MATRQASQRPGGLRAGLVGHGHDRRRVASPFHLPPPPPPPPTPPPPPPPRIRRVSVLPVALVVRGESGGSGRHYRLSPPPHAAPRSARTGGVAGRRQA